MKPVNSEKGFLGLTKKQLARHSLNEKAWILPFGYGLEDGTACIDAPKSIIDASKSITLFDERYICHPYQSIEFLTVKEPSFTASIRQALTGLKNIQEYFSQTEQFGLVIGGEHRLLIQTLSPWFNSGEDFVLIHLGAHAGLIADLASIYPDAKLIAMGLREAPEQLCRAQNDPDNHVHLYWARHKNQWLWSELQEMLKGKRVYLSVSVDIFDSSMMPATPWSEPGGLWWDELFDCIENISTMAKIVGGCVSDFAPIDTMPVYDVMVAKMIYRFISTVFLAARR